MMLVGATTRVAWHTGHHGLLAGEAVVRPFEVKDDEQ
jgi:hypothetical protein